MINHPAIKILNDLQKSNQISNAKFEVLYLKFDRLYHAIESSMQLESSLQKQASQLSEGVKIQKNTIENTAVEQAENRTRLAIARQVDANIQAELDITNEGILNTIANTKYKQNELTKLKEKVIFTHEFFDHEIEPQISQIKKEIQDLEDDISNKKKRILQMTEDSRRYLSQTQDLQNKIEELGIKQAEANQRIIDIAQIPLKMRNQANSVQSKNSSLLEEEKKQLDLLNNTDQEYDKLVEKYNKLEAELKQVNLYIQNIQNEHNDLILKKNTLQDKVSNRQENKTNKEYELHQIRKSTGETNYEINEYDHKIDLINKDILARKKQMKKMKEGISKTKIAKKEYEDQAISFEKKCLIEEENLIRFNQEFEIVQKRIEDIAKEIASSGSLNEIDIQEMKELIAKINQQKMILQKLADKETQMNSQIHEASIIKDRKARELTVIIKKTIDLRKKAQEKQAYLLELQRKHQFLKEKSEDLSCLYEKVRMERNRNASVIQSSRQMTVEFHDKIDMLNSEIQVLRKEYEQVTVSSQKVKNELKDAIKKRNTTKGDLRKRELEFQKFQEQIDLQANETERRNQILSKLETQIIYQQQRYSFQVDDCAAIQRALIDKQDTICLIFEQLNRNEEILKRGEKCLQEREEELKLVTLQLNDFIRKIELYQRKIPKLKDADEKIEEIQKQIYNEKKLFDDFVTKLEDPHKNARKKTYSGKDFTLEELQEKVKIYEERCNNKQQQIREKQILLDQLDEKISNLKKKFGKEKSIKIKNTKRATTAKVDGMKQRRKKMAALSEMAIYMAEAEEIKEETLSARQFQEEAKIRTARGQAYDDYAYKVVKLHERDIQSARTPKRKDLIELEEYEQTESDNEDKPKGRIKYDAYPTADGLSRPYGAFPVFQPSQATGNLRFFHKEASERPIQV